MRAKLGNVGYALHRVGVLIGLRFGGSFYYPSADREVLENRILPFYQLSESHQDILFVGTDWYTHGYPRLFSHKRSFATLDYAPGKARYGARKHLTGSVTDLARLVPAASLDLIVLNGVIGWGLDRLEDAERAIGQCLTCLRPGGHLIIGWNDIDEHRPFKLTDIPSLAAFRPEVLPSLGAVEILIENEWRHVFSVYAAPAAVAVPIETAASVAAASP
jgi:SAM-dependent methyltransferase